MEIALQIAAWLDAQSAQAIREHASSISEIRLRLNRPVQIACVDGKKLWGAPVDGDGFSKLLNYLMKNSLYACEQELAQGFFTAGNGCRVGVCGKLCADRDDARMANISSICIRIPRERHGCADELFESIYRAGFSSSLILSPPGKGKTTLLREIVRRISDDGVNVAIADERDEISACVEGVPALDVGRSTDVMCACGKARAISMMLRSCAPEIIAVDEIGGMEDAEALCDAARCGVKIIATAHAQGIAQAHQRKAVRALLDAGIFEYCLELGPEPGAIGRILHRKDGEYRDVEGNFAFGDPDRLRWNRPRAFQ